MFLQSIEIIICPAKEEVLILVSLILKVDSDLKSQLDLDVLLLFKT